MKTRRNAPRTITPHVRLKRKRRVVVVSNRPPKKVQPLYPSTADRDDARATLHIRRVLRKIHKQKDGEEAFLLLADFFDKYPVETLGPRASKEIALLMSGEKMTTDDFIFVVESCEIALDYLSKMETLLNKLRYVGFPQSQSGLRRARRLHSHIWLWQLRLKNDERKAYRLAA